MMVVNQSCRHDTHCHAVIFGEVINSNFDSNFKYFFYLSVFFFTSLNGLGNCDEVGFSLSSSFLLKTFGLLAIINNAAESSR